MLKNLPPTTPSDGKGTAQRSLHVFETGDRKTEGVQLPYLSGLDGLRALAVIAVLLYHAELGWFPGGFLGVEIFFVISGYLITSLLLAEWRQRGRIDLKNFWLRRARRLLPALYLLLVVTLAFAVVFLPEEVARLRSDAIAAFGYVTNWYLVFGHQSYFETAGRPSLLQHLWSLAIEEQFYLLWPLLLTIGMARMRWRRRGVQITAGLIHWRRRRMLFAVLVGAVVSALLMATLYQPDVDPSRVYYGTDTRATGLLVGAALALAWAPRRVPVLDGMDRSATARRRRLGRGQWWRRFRRRWGWTAPLLLDVIGLAALGGLVLFCLWLNESQPFLFRGGFALVALTTAAAIMVVIHPRARLSTRLLEWGPLRWVGVRSYGIYLWHFPVFMVTRSQLDVPLDGLPLLALRLAVTVLIAGLSYRYVETPIRTGALGRAWRRLREAQGSQRWQLGVRWAGAAGTGVAFCVALGLAVAHAQPPAPPSYLPVESVHTEASVTTPETDTETSATTPKTDTVASTVAHDTAADMTKKPAPAVAPARASAPVGRVTAIGDSVMVGAAGELQRAIGNNLDIDAEVGRQAAAVIDILQSRRTAGQLGEVVVVDIGSNGPFNSEQFDEIMRVLKGVHRVVFVNVKVPRSWEQSNNEVLADGVWRYPNTVLVDWHGASVGRPELFVDDGYHLQPEGQQLYADLIAAQLNAP